MKKLMKRGLVLVLTAAIMLTAAGCKKKEAQEGQARKEFYYVPEFKELDLQFDSIDRMVADGDDAIMAVSSWDKETGRGERHIYRYNMMTGESSELPLTLDENTYVTQMAMNSQGNLLLVVNRSVIEGDAGTEAADTETKETATEAAAAAEAEEATASGEQAGEADMPVSFRNTLELWEVSTADGTLLNQADLTSAFQNTENAYISYMAIDNQDNLYISGGESEILLLDKAGKKLGSIAIDNWIDSLFSSKEGKVYLKQWGAEGPVICPVDLQTKSVLAPVMSELSSGYSYSQKYYQGREKGILVSDNTGVFAYDVENNIKTELFDWLDADISSDTVQELFELSDGRFWVVLRDWNEEQTSYTVACLKKTPASEMAEREEILLGTMWLSQDVRRNVIDFNKTNQKYHISVKEYVSDDYQAGIAQFNSDVAGAGCPDLIDVSTVNFAQYAEKGVFADLYPYMKRDGIAEEDYLENVLKAYEIDGKLYGIIPQFYISTTAAKTANVGNKSGWTLKEMLDFIESSNAENVFPYGSRTSVFNYCIYNNMDEFINWETGECKFNSEDFIRVLEFAAKFPEEPNYENDGEGISAKLRNNKILLMQTSISSVQEYQMMTGLFGGDVTFIGYPNGQSKGNLIQASNGAIAVSARSKHQDGGWEFVKSLLSDNYQDKLVKEHGNWGFPMKKSALEKQFAQDMKKEYYENEKGEQVEIQKTSWGYDDFNIDIYAATKEEVDAVRAIIASAEKVSGSSNTDEPVTIITEETEAFFKGQKNVKETADIIQNRIQVYVNEHR